MARAVQIAASASLLVSTLGCAHRSPVAPQSTPASPSDLGGRLQARLDRRGGDIFLPRLSGGRCYRVRGLWVTRSNTHIASNGACLRVVGPGPTRLHSADGDAIAATAAFFISRGSMGGRPPENVTIDGLRLFVDGIDGIDVYGRNVSIANVRVGGSPHDDVYIGGRTNLIGSSRKVVVTRSVLRGAQRNAISITSATDVRITRNVIAGAGYPRGAGPGAGIDIEPNTPSNPVSDVIVDDNFIVGNAGTGVELALDPNRGLPVRASGIAIVGNVILANALQRSSGGIAIAGGQRDGRGDVRVLGNRFRANGGGAVSRARRLRVQLLLRGNAPW